MADLRSIEEREYGWKPWLAVWTASYVIYEVLTGAALLGPEQGPFHWQTLIAHLAVGLALVWPSILYTYRHWSWYRQQPTTYLTWLGNLSGCAFAVVVCSGLITLVQTILGFSTDLSIVVHFWASLALVVVLLPHVAAIIWNCSRDPQLRPVLTSSRVFLARVALVVVGMLLVTWVLATIL